MNGTFKTCPRCKGYGYILGQKEYYKDYSSHLYYKDYSSHLPDYRKNKKGLCFLCDGKKEAFFTNDGRVFKFKKDKYRKKYIVEFCPLTGNLLGELTDFNPNTPEYETESHIHFKVSHEESLFPSKYEELVGGNSQIIDTILREHPMSKVVNVEHYCSEDGYTFNFLIYYDKNMELIKPFYAEPRYDESDPLLRGTAIVKDDYAMAVSGVYCENDDSLCLGIKNNEGFNSAIVKNIKGVFDTYKNQKIKREEISNFINNLDTLYPIMLKILFHVSDFIGVDVFAK